MRSTLKGTTGLPRRAVPRECHAVYVRPGRGRNGKIAWRKVGEWPRGSHRATRAPRLFVCVYSRTPLVPGCMTRVYLHAQLGVVSSAQWTCRASRWPDSFPLCSLFDYFCHSKHRDLMHKLLYRYPSMELFGNFVVRC